MRDPYDPQPPRRRFQILPDDRYIAWTPYLWLAYLPSVFIAPFVRHSAAPEWIATGAAVALFLPLYFRGYWARQREFYVIIAVIAAFGIALLPINPSAGTFITYAAAFAGVVRPRRTAHLILGALCAAIIVETALSNIGLWLMFIQLFFTLMVGAINLHFSRIREMNAELRKARVEIEHLAAVAERERIARDLHDVLGHTLTLITLKSALAARLVDRDPSRAANEMRDVERVARETLGEVRTAVTGYRGAMLAGAMGSGESMLAAAGVTMTTSIERVPLSPVEETALALALKEAVTNVVRHAGATTCHLSLHGDASARSLTIEDDGRGMQAEAGNGLRGMRERLATVGGELAIGARSGGGTRVTLTLGRAS